MKTLNKNTLFEISKHSNKTIKLINYMAKSEQPLMFSDLLKVSENDGPIQLIEALHKDIRKTAGELEKMHLLLSTVNDDNYVAHLENEEKNLKKILGEDYDENLKLIKLKTCNIDLRHSFDKDDILKQIATNMTGLSFDRYQDLYKNRKKIFKVNKDDLHNNDDKIIFLSTIKDQETYQKAIEKIKSYTKGYTTNRAKMSMEDKIKIDNEITFNRSMIDSVMKNSTYIEKEDGIKQLSKKHEENTKEINQLKKLINKSKTIKGVELDPDTSIKAVINLIEQVNEINFNLKSEVILKARKLGNYNANGLYMDSEKIVALDITNPSAAIHEFCHAVDFNDEEIFFSQERKNLMEKFRQNMDLKQIIPAKQQYYNSTVEIVARLGEVAYLLNKYDYKENETLDEFSERVKEDETRFEQDAYQLNLAKPIEQYLNRSANIYFNLKTMDKNTLLEAKNFYKSFFGVNNQEIKKLNTKEIAHEDHKIIRQFIRRKHEILPVGLFRPDNIQYALQYNEDNKVIDNSVIMNALIHNATNINKKTKAYNSQLYVTQKETITNAFKWLLENNKIETMYHSFYEINEVLHNKSHRDISAILVKGVKNNIQVNEKDYLENNPTQHSLFMASRKALVEIGKHPSMESISKKRTQAIYTDKDKEGRITKSLNDHSATGMYQGAFEIIRKYIEDNSLEKLLKYAEKDDELLMHLAINKNLQRKLGLYSEDSFNTIKNTLANTGTMETIANSKCKIIQNQICNREFAEAINAEHFLGKIISKDNAKKLVNKEINISELSEEGITIKKEIDLSVEENMPEKLENKKNQFKKNQQLKLF